MQSSFAPGVPVSQPIRSNGATYVPSSFGASATTFGPGFRAHGAFNGQRARELEFRERFFRCEHHDGKLFDFNGRVVRPGPPSTQPLIGASLPTFYVPLDQRRPHDPYRIAKLVVDQFTGLVFGEGMWPQVHVAGDPETQDFATALSEAQRLDSVMHRARNVGGSTGTVGLSWRFFQGRPRTRVHRPQFLHVHEWADREALVPAHVTQLYQVERRVYDPRRRAEATMLFWYRRDWTTEADVAFVEAPVTKEDPYWVVDEAETYQHKDGFCHFVWVQNLPDEDESSIDGRPDYDGLYENMNSLDTIASVTTRGGVLNLDPTLKLKMDPEVVKRYGVKKGSDNALVVGLTGDADYMELAGTSVAAGNALVDRRRSHILEASQCVVPDPNTIAAAGTSSLAIKLVYRPSLGRANLLRTQYGDAIERILEQQIRSARRHLRPAEPAPYELSERAVEGDDGAERVEYFLDLPPRVATEEIVDEATGLPTGEVSISFVERTPGQGGDVELRWPAYFEMTAGEKQQELAALGAATAGKAVLSHKTAVRLAAQIVGVDPDDEWEQVTAEETARREAELGMFPGAGGRVPDDPAAGAEPPLPDDPEPAPEEPDDAAPEPAPEKVDPLDAPGPEQRMQVSPAFVLNGSQIQAAVAIVTAVNAGEMPRDAGLGQLQILFNLTEQQAMKIMGSAGMPAAGATPAPPAAPPSPPPPSPPPPLG